MDRESLEQFNSSDTYDITCCCSVLNFCAKVTTNQRQNTGLCRVTSSVWNLRPHHRWGRFESAKREACLLKLFVWRETGILSTSTLELFMYTLQMMFFIRNRAGLTSFQRFREVLWALSFPFRTLPWHIWRVLSISMVRIWPRREVFTPSIRNSAINLAISGK